MKKTRKLKADPIAAELIRNSLVAATEEMKSVLMRTSYNMIIYEALDFTVGLFDRRGGPEAQVRQGRAWRSKTNG